MQVPGAGGYVEKKLFQRTKNRKKTISLAKPLLPAKATKFQRLLLSTITPQKIFKNILATHLRKAILLLVVPALISG